MRFIPIFISSVLFGLACSINPTYAQQVKDCKVCRDQQSACTKNYAGPTCKTEYQICMKSCKPK